MKIKKQNQARQSSALAILQDKTGFVYSMHLQTKSSVIECLVTKLDGGAQFFNRAQSL